MRTGVRQSIGEALTSLAHAILAEAQHALESPANSDAVAVHEFRKAMKRWRALMRLLQPFVGTAARDWRIKARDLARALAEARDRQATVDALADLTKVDAADRPLSTRSIETIRTRIAGLRQTAEATALTDAMRERLGDTLGAAAEAVRAWPIADMGFGELARGLALGYGRARGAIPDDWSAAGAEDVHEFRQRVVVHRYQIELVVPLWPRLGKLWTAEAQRLRERLGACQDLAVLETLIAPHQPLAAWRSRIIPLIAARRAVHVAAARRLSGRLFAEKPRAFRRRMDALWEHRADLAD